MFTILHRSGRPTGSGGRRPQISPFLRQTDLIYRINIAGDATPDYNSARYFSSITKRSSRQIFPNHVAKMAKFLVTAALMVLSLAEFGSAKVWNRCDLARALANEGVPRNDVAMWICIATHESSLNSEAVNRKNGDGSWDHGLWQINDKWWVGRDHRGGGCNLSAGEVRGDHIGAAVGCVRRVLEEHQRLQGNGWLAWTAFSRLNHCKGDVNEYVAGCF